MRSESGAMEVYDRAEGGEWSRPPAFPSAAGGLVSTVDDYLAFGRMLLHRGRHGGERILSRLSVEAMTTDQLTAEQKALSGFVPGFWDSRGWGFGVSVITRRDGVAAVHGRFGWDGGPRHLVVVRSHRRAGRDPDDPAHVDLPPGPRRLSRLLDPGLPGHRRLKPPGTHEEMFRCDS